LWSNCERLAPGDFSPTSPQHESRAVPWPCVHRVGIGGGFPCAF
jgi:hypothetical protein